MSKAAHLGEGRGSRQGESLLMWLTRKVTPVQPYGWAGRTFLGRMNGLSLQAVYRRLLCCSDFCSRNQANLHSVITIISGRAAVPSPACRWRFAKKNGCKARDKRVIASFFRRLNQKKPLLEGLFLRYIAYHLGEGRALKTQLTPRQRPQRAYHLGEGRALKTVAAAALFHQVAYHLGEGRALKTLSV